jgi:broad specificity phosphatase PhoE
MKRVVAVLLLFACGVVSCNRAEPGSTVVLVVRHAEKASDAEDSPLSEAGVQRAQALARAAGDAGASAIYATQFKRSHDTAQPLAERLGVAVTEMPVNLQNPGDYGRRLAGDIIAKHRGQTVVVVGHANTVASIVEGLSGRPAAPGDAQYGDMFIVTVPPSGAATVIKAQYGFGGGG